MIRRHTSYRRVRRAGSRRRRMSFEHFRLDGLLRFRSVAIKLYFHSSRLHHHPRSNLAPIRFHDRIDRDEIPILRFPVPPIAVVFLL